MGRWSLSVSRERAPGKELASNVHWLRHARNDVVAAGQMVEVKCVG